MNCKPGDLAIVVKSHAGNEGKIVRCLKFAGIINMMGPDDRIDKMECWEIEGSVTHCGGGTHNLMPDECLRPIRDNDQQDEMIRIAGLPKELESV